MRTEPTAMPDEQPSGAAAALEAVEPHAPFAVEAAAQSSQIPGAKLAIAGIVAGVLPGCGGGGSSGGASDGGTAPSPSGSTTPTPTSTPTAPAATVSGPNTAAEAARFLSQATFGPNDAAISELMTKGYSAWIDGQLNTPIAQTHLAQWDVRAVNGWGAPTFYKSWWKGAFSGADQLRQRLAFALSQIFVVSLFDLNVEMRGAVNYYDMLNTNAFGNFRKLLEDVTLNPQMGRYLTYLGNTKEDAAGTRHPDENYAREIMQLFTIGLVQLNNDGTKKLDGSGNPIPTYTQTDVAGLAKVFTGISWQSPNPNANSFLGIQDNINAGIRPMIFYPDYHSTSQKTFLGVTIPAASTPDVGGDLRIALDALFNHANVGPFIGFRLIQQFVTSNPSPAYVGRVASVFNNNGAGVRGDMAAVIKAVLLDSEARDAGNLSSTTFGKAREPVMRISAWGRAFNATTVSGDWDIGNTTATISLSQSPLSAPSVFNFWRPGYSPPAVTEAGSRNLVAPEFQIIDEVTTATWVNTAYEFVQFGSVNRDVSATYAAEQALAHDPAALLNRVNGLLFAGQMSDALKTKITAAINNVPFPGASEGGARLFRAKTAVFLSLVAPEFMIQR